MIPVSRLKELFSYDPETGEFRHLVDRGTRGRAGAIATCKTSQGYLVLSADGKLIRSGRAAIAMMTGEWPRGVVDHINRNREDDAWVNLRDDVSGRINCTNYGKYSNNKSGHAGVRRRGDKFEAVIRYKGEQKYLGMYSTFEDACAVRRHYEGLLGFSPTHGRAM